MKQLIWGFLLSIIIHMSFGFSLWQMPTGWLLDQIKSDTIVVDFVESNKPDFANVVRQTEAPENLKTQEKTKTRFLSEKQQFVVQETRAQNTGLTQNSQSLSEKSWLRKWEQQKNLAKNFELQKNKNNTNSANKERDEDGFLQQDEKNSSGSSSIFDLSGPSTVGEKLPDDVALGTFTALNTDRFQFYSFYSRIEELVRFRWERFLEAAVQGFDQRTTNMIAKRSWITHVELVLSHDGHFKAGRIMKESGVRYFDLAAVNAFKEAAFFPNPPKELVGDDGLVRIKYSFNVHWTPTAMARARE